MSSEDHPDWWRPMGGQNSQDSILERRSLVWNDDGILNGTVPDNIYDAEIYKGKFFTRGCRGMLEQLQLYCIGDGVDEITLRYSPHPCLGPVGEVTIVPAAAWAWQDFNIEAIWNYDSLFIWVHEAEANVDWAYDAVLPYDGHESADTGVTWSDMAIRPFIRAVMTGETPGDVPVSGIVNTIEIPSVATVVEADPTVNVPHNTLTELCELEGAGTMIDASWAMITSVTPTGGVAPPAVRYELHVYVDGVLGYWTDNGELTQSFVATSGRASHGVFYQGTVADPVWDRTHMSVKVPLKFRRRLTLYALQTTGAAVTAGGAIFANLLV